MQFQLFPILETIEELYSQPISKARFEKYLRKLQGSTKGDMEVPIMSFNPMAKSHIHQKIAALKALDAEVVMKDTIQKINTSFSNDERIIQVTLALADDLGGAWTNRYTTDFSSKFQTRALVKRNFCTPHFWTSENYTEELIIQRTRAYIYRTAYVIQNLPPVTLEAHLAQEIFVQKNSSASLSTVTAKDFENIVEIYEGFQEETDYNLIFNFFYGDAACESLAFPSYGIGDLTGFDYAKFLATRPQ